MAFREHDLVICLLLMSIRIISILKFLFVGIDFVKAVFNLHFGNAVSWDAVR